MDLDVYFSPTDHLRGVLEVVLVLLLVAFLANECVEMRTAFVNHGTVLPYFYELENWLDLAVYSILLSAAALWVRAYAVQSHKIDPRISIDANAKVNDFAFDTQRKASLDHLSLGEASNTIQSGKR